MSITSHVTTAATLTITTSQVTFIRIIIFGVFLLLDNSSLVTSHPANSFTAVRKPVLIIVSYDGFSNDYFLRNLTPNMEAYRKSGVTTRYMKNIFPTKTFPNHFSIATGVYPEKHGVFSSEMYDFEAKERIKYSYEMFHFNKEVIPIWTWNELNGGISGCMMWSASNFEYAGLNCTYTQNYDTKVSGKDRIDTVISWLKENVKSPNLIMLYVEQPDKTGHSRGVKSAEVSSNLSSVDFLTGYLDDALTANNFDKFVNVIHLSDHGMIDVSLPYFINLHSFIGNNSVSMYGTSPVLQIVPNDNSNEDNIYNNLVEAAKSNGHFRVYKNNELPKKWNIRNANRFGPITAIADEGYAFQDMISIAKYYEEFEGVPFTIHSKYGIHGYDNDLPSMWSYFMARGPVFRRNYEIEPFNSVDLFPLICMILDLKVPKIIDGNLDNVISMIDDADDVHRKNRHFTLIVVIALFVFLIIGSVALVHKRYGFIKTSTTMAIEEANSYEKFSESQKLMESSPINSD